MAPDAGGGLGVVDDLAADALLDQRQALLGHALGVEAHRQPGRVPAVVDDRDQGRGDLPALLEERAILLDRQRREPEVAEHVEQVDDRVLVEDDGVVAGIDVHGVRARLRALGGLAADRRGVDLGRVDGALLRVAGPVVGAHRDREQLRGRAALGGADPLGVGDGDGLGLGGERPERRDAGVVRRGDDVSDALGPQLGAGVGRALGPAGVERRRRIRGRQARPLLELLDGRGDRGGTLDERLDPLVVDPAGRRHADPAAVHEPEVDERLGAGDVLVDLRVGEARQGRFAGHDQGLGLARARPLGRVDDLLGEAKRLLGVAPDPVLGAHPITPTRTLRNRPPETPWPTWPVCPGSPLPQFGVPHIRQLEASPMASIDRHSSYVMPV